MRFVALFVFFLLLAVSFNIVPSNSAHRRVSVHVEVEGGEHKSHHEQQSEMTPPMEADFSENENSSASSLSSLSSETSRPTVNAEKYSHLQHQAANGAVGWPPAGDVVPYEGAILPFNRIVCYYGAFESKALGILGRGGSSDEAVEETMRKLKEQTNEWQQADNYPAIPCVDYIASVAQGSPGAHNLWTGRVSDSKIANAITVAKKHGAITILEIQPGWGRMCSEAKVLEKYLLDPTVHLAVDPEFEMNDGTCDASGAQRQHKTDADGPNGKPKCYAPGKAVGRIHGEEINEIIDWLAELVDKHSLPPKILVVHRFQSQSLVNSHVIKKTPQVQVVIDMDGWGRPSTKKGTYHVAVEQDPIQFAGIKLFAIWDLWLGSKVGTGNAPSTMLTHDEVLKEIKPHPLYIQYQ